MSEAAAKPFPSKGQAGADPRRWRLPRLERCGQNPTSSRYPYPGFRELIVESAVSSDHFATMQVATGGDFTHGLIHPEQMLGGRTRVPGSSHRTPIEGLFLCSASCHPGPEVADWLAA